MKRVWLLLAVAALLPPVAWSAGGEHKLEPGMVVAINIWGALEVVDTSGRRSTERDFARALKVQFTPTLLILDADGAIALRLDGYYPPHKFSAALDYAGATRPRGTLAENLATVANESAIGKLHAEPGAIGAPYRLADAVAGGRNREAARCFAPRGR